MNDDDLRNGSLPWQEADRTHSAPRPRTSAGFPAANDGLDGDTRMVYKDGKLYFCVKSKGAWWKKEMERV